MFKRKKGFTVIEIVIVIAVVAIIAGIWYTSKNKAGADVKNSQIPIYRSSSTVKSSFGNSATITNVKFNPADPQVGQDIIVTFDLITTVKNSTTNPKVSSIGIAPARFQDGEYQTAFVADYDNTIIKKVTKGKTTTTTYQDIIKANPVDVALTRYEVIVVGNFIDNNIGHGFDYPGQIPTVQFIQKTSGNGDTTGAGSSGSGSGTAGVPTTSQ